ncbi:MAG: PilZ domain-containing protein [Nitrospinae bacterium]|nr:PilZ domain-containing protein [Nitrospinota bacterium]
MFAAGIDITLEGDPGTTHTMVRGWKEGAYFLIDAPPGAWRNIPGSEALCRIDHDGRYYGFAAPCLALLPELNLLVFGWPDDIMENDRRTASRFDITMPVTVYRNMGGKEVGHNDGVITDLSRGGCRLICERAYQEGDKILMTGHLPLGERTAAAEAYIRRRLEHRGKGSAYGLQFVGIDHDTTMESFFERMERYHNREHHVDVEAIVRGEALPVGERSLVQLAGERVVTTLRGYRALKYALLEIPVKEKGPVVAAPGQIYGVRFFQGGEVFSFESALLKQYLKPPFLLWVFKFPETFDRVSLRKSPRIKTFIAGSVVANGGARSEGAFIDLSSGGGLFVADDGVYTVGENILIDLAIPPGKNVEGLACAVKSVERRGGKVSLGLAFLDLEGAGYMEVYSFYSACRSHTVHS